MSNDNASSIHTVSPKKDTKRLKKMAELLKNLNRSFPDEPLTQYLQLALVADFVEDRHIHRILITMLEDSSGIILVEPVKDGSAQHIQHPSLYDRKEYTPPKIKNFVE